MSIGSNIMAARKAAGLTQEQLAERLEVSFQAVSAWERDEYLPEAKKLTALAKALDASLDALLDGGERPWKPENPNFDAERMYTYLKARAQGLHLAQTLAVLPLIREKHAGQLRKSRSGAIPYCTHPLTLACHALAMGLEEDDVIAALLLHDVVEDTGTPPEALPVNERVRETVRLVSYNTYPGTKEQIKPEYYANIGKAPLAALVKCIDRCNNLSCMADGFTREKMKRYVVETEQYVLPLLDVIREIPEWNNAAWLLRYQIRSLLESFKRML